MKRKDTLSICMAERNELHLEATIAGARKAAAGSNHTWEGSTAASAIWLEPRNNPTAPMVRPGPSRSTVKGSPPPS